MRRQRTMIIHVTSRPQARKIDMNNMTLTTTNGELIATVDLFQNAWIELFGKETFSHVEQKGQALRDSKDVPLEPLDTAPTHVVVQDEDGNAVVVDASRALPIIAKRDCKTAKEMIAILKDEGCAETYTS